MHPVVRSPVEADAEAIGSIHVRAWKAAYGGGLMPADALESLSVHVRVKTWKQRLAQPVADRSARLVAEDSAGLVVGFAIAGPEGRDAEAGIGEVYAMYVDPRRWRTGVGSALHASALDALRKAAFEQAVLWVLPGNHRARRFYESRGWQADGAERVATFLGADVPVVRYSVGLG